MIKIKVENEERSLVDQEEKNKEKKKYHHFPKMKT
jgi:hypothetical protein